MLDPNPAPCGTVQAPQPSASPEQQVKAVQGLLLRLLPEHTDLFNLKFSDDCGGTFHVSVLDGKVNLEGGTGVALASALHWFLKYLCNASVSWDATGGLQLNVSKLSEGGLKEMESRGKVSIDRAVPLSFYQNVVTMSYSMAYWDWHRWEREIDWMALQGINLPLAPAGMEFAWLKTFAEFKLTAEDLEDFFPGPAFLAWGRMGNIQGYGGPLSFEYMEKQAELQQSIVARMRSFGMVPVLPAFAGFVPRSFVQRYPEAKAVRSSNWCHFPDQFSCPYLLDPMDPMFQEIGTSYIRNLRSLYGWDRSGFYIADTFNEMRPASADPVYLAGISRSVYASMVAADSTATWLMQAWLFFSDQYFWQPPQVQALLSGVPKGKLILLDLFAEEHPIWERTNSFFGYPFVWCMLHNFGGNLEMYGALSNVVQGVSRAHKQHATICGIGMAPEGIEQNPVVYELMAEMAYSQRLDVILQDWILEYAQRRYGGVSRDGLSEAWGMLLDTVYTCTDRQRTTVMDVPTSRPGLTRTEIIGWGLRPHLWYDLRDLLVVWELLLDSSVDLADNSAFTYDLVDVSREVLSKMSTSFWQQVVHSYLAKDLAGLRTAGQALLGLLQDLDSLLATHPAFLLGRFLRRARSYASSDVEAAAYEWNARTQITIWGTSPFSGDSEVSDYANKEWSGLISSFYAPRWALWLQHLEQDLELGREYDREAWRQECLKFTFTWAVSTETFPSKSTGSSVLVSRKLYEKYAQVVSAPVGTPEQPSSSE